MPMKMGQRGDLSTARFTSTTTVFSTDRSMLSTKAVPMSFCPAKRKPSITNTRLFGAIKDDNDNITSLSTSSPPTTTAKKGFGAPPPPPTAEELEARGKRAAQKQKYREQIKMAKSMPTLKKIVKSGVDDKVTTNSKVKGCGGAA